MQKLCCLAGTLLFLFNDSYLSQMERSAEFNTLQGNIATQLAAFAYLLRQWALPLWLNIDPDLPLLRDLSGSLLQTLFFLAAFALMLACWRRRPWLGFALAWAIIQLLPLHLLLPRLDIANDRQLYLACWPLFLALAAELALLRNQVYVDEVALWEVRRANRRTRRGHTTISAMPTNSRGAAKKPAANSPSHYGSIPDTSRRATTWRKRRNGG